MPVIGHANGHAIRASSVRVFIERLHDVSCALKVRPASSKRVLNIVNIDILNNRPAEWQSSSFNIIYIIR